MAILPFRTDRRIGDELTAAMSRLDGCGECIYNTEMPRAAMPDGTGGWLCHYVCTDCGHTWKTTWGSL